MRSIRPTSRSRSNGPSQAIASGKQWAGKPRLRRTVAARREAVRTGFATAQADDAQADALADERERELAEEDLRAAG